MHIHLIFAFSCFHQASQSENYVKKPFLFQVLRTKEIQ